MNWFFKKNSNFYSRSSLIKYYSRLDVSLKETFISIHGPRVGWYIKYEKKIPSKEELWDMYYMGALEQQRQFIGSVNKISS